MPNSETGNSAERPVNPLQRAVLHKEQQQELSTNSETGITHGSRNNNINPHWGRRGSRNNNINPHWGMVGVHY